MKWVIAAGLIVVILTGCALDSPPVASEVRPEPIYVIEIKGVINPLSARYFQRAVAEAERDNAGLLVMLLDTPGGLDTAMRDMTQAILAARVPVAVYVAPSGARAASAGMFLTLAAHVAAMAPGTNIGAAHPVSLGGSQQQDDIMASKVAQDAAATARALAVTRGRSAEWAEKAVLNSVSLTSAEALSYGLIDTVAETLDDLLAQLDGRNVMTGAGSLSLRTNGAPRVTMPMNIVEQMLHIITDPNIAYLLLTLGLYSLLIEFQAPGFGLPGTVGIVALALAFIAFGSLPLNWAGLGLIGLGAILLVAEFLSPSFGAMGIGGAAMFLIGSLILYQPFTPAAPGLPTVMVNPWLVIGITGLTAALIFFAVGKGLSAQRGSVSSDLQRRIVGMTGYAATDLTPVGTAQIGAELWTAVAENGEFVRAGESVVVTALEGITVRVRRAVSPSNEESGG
jgi:membrane-bound serine protease (ClpP class)